MGNDFFKYSGAYELPVNHECTVQERYFIDIKNGKKTVEGRINDGKFKFFKSGDTLKIINNKNTNERVLCKIVDVVRYSNFKDMLTYEGVDKCLPGIRKISEGVNIYHGISDYEERAKKFGVLAIRLKLIIE